jgi:phosphoribosylformimino-5-aminoimidazole carboxamide ribotide isomerase
MRVIAAVDILNGQVVAGLSGIRESYKPLISKVVSTTNPFKLIMGMREALGLNDFYIADLDAILTGKKNEHLYSSLVKEGVRIYLDAGSKNCADLQYLMNMNVFKVVAGLETIESIRELKFAAQMLGSRLVFSLDMKNGVPFTTREELVLKSPQSIMIEAINAGVDHLFILDLAKVGTGNGASTDGLVAKARAQSEKIFIMAGGGIGSFQEVIVLKTYGANAVVISRALHDGTFGKETIKEILAF